MSIKTLFNGIGEIRNAKRNNKALVAAIKAEDLDGVKKALAAGASVTYYNSIDALDMPLVRALYKGNPEIFKAMLDTKEGLEAATYRYTEFRPFWSKAINDRNLYFTPSFLYTAIEYGKEDIALLLAKNPAIDPQYSGYVVPANKTRKEVGDEYKGLVMTPIELARAQGMTAVVEALEEKLKPLHAEQKRQEAATLAEKAATLRAEAEKLEREANALVPPPKVASQGGLRL